MNTYTIYLGAVPVACVSGDRAYGAYNIIKAVAEATDRSAMLVWDATGEIIAEHKRDGWDNE